jgi:hypothetical protein
VKLDFASFLKIFLLCFKLQKWNDISSQKYRTWLIQLSFEKNFSILFVCNNFFLKSIMKIDNHEKYEIPWVNNKFIGEWN